MFHLACHIQSRYRNFDYDLARFNASVILAILARKIPGDLIHGLIGGFICSQRLDFDLPILPLQFFKESVQPTNPLEL
jgi:hypothetical protein